MQCLVRSASPAPYTLGGNGALGPSPHCSVCRGRRCCPHPTSPALPGLHPLLGQAVSRASTVPLELGGTLGALLRTSLRRLLAHRFAMPTARARALRMLKVPEAVVSLEVPQLPARVPPGLRWELPVPGSSSAKPVVPEDTLGWHSTGAPRTPTSAAALLLWPRGPRMTRAPPGTPHAPMAGHHHVTRADQPLPGLQPRFSPSHHTSALASDPHGVQPADGCRRCPRSPLASRTSPPLRGRRCHQHPSAARRSRDASHFARGPAGAWLCCVFVLAVS